MLSEILSLLRKGYNVSVESIASELHSDSDSVHAALEQLVSMGFLRMEKPCTGKEKICAGCFGCSGCSGCGNLSLGKTLGISIYSLV